MDGSESTERNEYLAAVKGYDFWLALVPQQYTADREIVQAAANQDVINGIRSKPPGPWGIASLSACPEHAGQEPHWMDGSSENTERNEYERNKHLAAVKAGFVLALVPEQYKADREIVLAAVNKNGMALRYAAEECKADSEIVLAAVKQTVNALQHAGAQCKADHGIVLAA
eukprot:3364395-Amphidinium_carterae.1